eukprot:TRINITY_DN307_c0_g1_i1.p1 TRINITY_DN307_c0_g1~~TRINITY_DN307_c0_g1_i1.p1  ORF type:complete len:1402 (+),score=340.59 TRINITY_DN307_c0_g1_i1:217-4422(+)
MGNNYCKDLGIRPDQAIGSKDLEAIWTRYEKKASVANSGVLSEKSTTKLLKDLAAATKVPYSEELATKLVLEHQHPQNKTLNYEQFKKLIKSLVQEEPRFHLTQSLMTKLEDEPEEPPVTTNNTAGQPANPPPATTTTTTPTTEPTVQPTVENKKPEESGKQPEAAAPASNSLKTSAQFETVRNLQKAQTSEEKAKKAELRDKRGVVSLPWAAQDAKRYRRHVTIKSDVAGEIIYRPDRCFELVYGENTSLPISVLEASFRFDIIPFLNSALVEIELVITNNVVSNSIQGKLRLPLSKGAVVSRFAYEAIAGHMVDGVVLPKKKAAAVEYLEKEKGRNVASTKKVEGDLFETTVFPLPYQEKRKMIIQYLSQLDSNKTADGKTEWSVSIPFKFAAPLQLFCASFFVFPESDEEILTSSPSEARNTTLEEGFRISGFHREEWRRQVMFAVGESDDLVHFAAHISPEVIKQLFGNDSTAPVSVATPSQPVKIGVIWDKSDSMQNAAEENLKVLDSIKEEYLEKNKQEVLFKVFEFNTFAKRLGDTDSYVPLDQAKELISKIAYDGGTDVSCIDGPVSQFCNEGVDMILLFSDGLDNVGHAKRIPQEVMDATKPIHVFGPTQGNSNQALLGSIASRTGGFFESASKINAVIGNIMGLTPITQVAAVEIETVLGEGSIEDLFFDEGFVTVPDWKLRSTGWAISENQGGYVTGTISKFNPVEKLSLEIQRGNQTKSVTLQLGGGLLTDGLARLIALIHCQQAMNESRKLHVDPAFSSHYQSELALKYKIVSEETSLLFLLEAQQFIDNSIDCPKNHPAHAEWARLFANIDPKKKKEREAQAEVSKLQNKCKNLLSALKRALDVAPKPASTSADTGSFLTNTLRRVQESVAAPSPPGGPMLCSALPPPAPCVSAPPPPAPCVSAPAPVLSGPPPSGGGPILQRRSAVAAPAPRARSAAPSSASRLEAEPMISMSECAAVPCNDLISPDVQGYAASYDCDEEDNCSIAEESLKEECEERRRASPEMLRRESAPREKRKSSKKESKEKAIAKDKKSKEANDATKEEPKNTTKPTVAAKPQRSAPVMTSPDQYLSFFNNKSYSDDARRRDAYQSYLEVKTDNQKTPSFYFNIARLFYDKGVDPKLCVAIITNALEINVQDIQMFRAVAYFLLQANFLSQAILMFERVMELAPEEPQSFLDLGLAQFMLVRSQRIKTKQVDKDELSKAIDNVMTVLRRTTWQPRFDEIEYPALIWINWMVGYGKHHGLTDFYPKELDQYELLVPNFKMGLVVSMGWDTDRVDIDLHVNEPDGFHVYYGSKNSPSGGYLSKDFTQGYGPEVYVITHPRNGTYSVSVRYFASHQDSKTTGATSAVVWRVINIGDYEKEDVLFRSVRLTVNQSEHHIMSVSIAN